MTAEKRKAAEGFFARAKESAHEGQRGLGMTAGSNPAGVTLTLSERQKTRARAGGPGFGCAPTEVADGTSRK